MAKLLIVEDEPEAVEVMEEFFKGLGFEVQSASNGQEALALIKSFEPRVIILDIKMPIMSGEKFLQNIQKDPSIKDKNVDVIITTGFNDGGLTKERIMRYDVRAYLEKPVSLDQLEEVVQGLNL